MVGIFLLLRSVVVDAEEAFTLEKVPGLMWKKLLKTKAMRNE